MSISKNKILNNELTILIPKLLEHAKISISMGYPDEKKREEIGWTLPYLLCVLEHLDAIHALMQNESGGVMSVSSIARSMLEEAAVLSWLLSGAVDEVTKKLQILKKLRELYKVIADSSSNFNARAKAVIGYEFYFDKAGRTEIEHKRFDKLSVENLNYHYEIYNKKLTLTKIMNKFYADFSFSVVYDSLSAVAHSNPIILVALMSYDSNKRLLAFNNNDPIILSHALVAATESCLYIMNKFFSLTQNTAALTNLKLIESEYSDKIRHLI